MHYALEASLPLHKHSRTAALTATPAASEHMRAALSTLYNMHSAADSSGMILNHYEHMGAL